MTFNFPSLDERPVSSAAFAGRAVVLAFVATWDLPSQAQLSYLREMAKRETRRERGVAFVAVFMQEPRDRELVDVYRSTLGIDFAAALVPPSIVASSFPDVQSVPTTLVLDASGQVRFQKVGLAKPDELRGALHAH